MPGATASLALYGPEQWPPYTPPACINMSLVWAGQMSRTTGSVLTGSSTEVSSDVLTGPRRRPRLGPPGTGRQLHRLSGGRLQRRRAQPVPSGTCIVPVMCLPMRSDWHLAHLCGCRSCITEVNVHGRNTWQKLSINDVFSDVGNSAVGEAMRSWKHFSCHQRGDLGRARACRRWLRNKTCRAGRGPVRRDVGVGPPPLRPDGPQAGH